LQFSKTFNQYATGGGPHKKTLGKKELVIKETEKLITTRKRRTYGMNTASCKKIIVVLASLLLLSSSNVFVARKAHASFGFRWSSGFMSKARALCTT
jgi:hypothetical protein